jgi:ribose 5-phosphate isomerase A
MSAMAIDDERKRAVGRRAADFVEDGMIVGLGTGSTADHLIERLGERVAEGLQIHGVPTSDRTADRARARGIPLLALDECPYLDVAIDGADQVDTRADLIKGLGGALYREKLVARAARDFIVIVDETKLVDRLGAPCPVPVEVNPDSWREVRTELRALGADPTLRMADGRPYITDNGNLIVDALFDEIDRADHYERAINEIPGVVENGLFVGMASRVLIAEPMGVRQWTVGSADSTAG